MDMKHLNDFWYLRITLLMPTKLSDKGRHLLPKYKCY
jgi:hypothetical protein